jgi:hypothetical protein
MGHSRYLKTKTETVKVKAERLNDLYYTLFFMPMLIGPFAFRLFCNIRISYLFTGSTAVGCRQGRITKAE